MKYNQPEYYKNFSCKGGACRHTCCHGWGITLSMNEYYRLLGLECEPSLRRRLDTAFYPLDTPSEERFAMVNLRYDGDCPLHAEDGLCELHRQKGEGKIPSVCRMYPRSVRGNGCCCTDSCEAVIERLSELGGILTFDASEREYPANGEDDSQATVAAFEAIEYISDTAFPLPVRIYNYGKVIGVPAADFKLPPYEAMKRISDTLISGSDAVEEYVSPSVYAVYDESGAEKRYPEAVEALENEFPDVGRLLANILINHIFYDRFELYKMTPENRFDVLCLLYALMRITVAGFALTAKGKDDKNGLVDCIAGLFRYAEHSNFDENAPRLLKKYSVIPSDLLAF